MNSIFVVNKEQLEEAKFVKESSPVLTDGEILLKVEQYYLSSNNITYAVIGEKYKYWNFFPKEEPWGAIPVWAYLSVIESKHPTIEVGECFFGFAPMADSFKVCVGNYTAHGFSDRTAHREGLIALYNYYTKTEAKQLKQEGIFLLTKITFPTSFLIHFFLEEEAFFDAQQIVITSASSKTALGLAFLLKKYQDKTGKDIIGITASKNKSFVEQSGYYDKVISYTEIKDVLPQKQSVVLDISGNVDVLVNINALLQEDLKHIARIGITDWTANKEFENFPNAVPFVVGDQYKKMLEKLGPQKTTELLMEEQHSFTASIQKIISLSYIKTVELPIFYQKLLKGTTNPKLGYIVQQ